ncbi:uncharacterized protein LOC112903220 [Panicum hallii]|uniref:uncharacterized protein LOC112903220 n=1 Tax=Panicum hallii TaxID=206008 RepID=UPI000DF4E05D|nr:uncharacterized protein LOC112903220 [Panicum hallii]
MSGIPSGLRSGGLDWAAGCDGEAASRRRRRPVQASHHPISTPTCGPCCLQPAGSPSLRCPMPPPQSFLCGLQSLPIAAVGRAGAARLQACRRELRVRPRRLPPPHPYRPAHSKRSAASKEVRSLSRDARNVFHGMAGKHGSESSLHSSLVDSLVHWIA